MVPTENHDSTVLPTSNPPLKSEFLDEGTADALQDFPVVDPLLADAAHSASKNFSAKVYAGVSWTLLSSVASQILNLVRSVMLARLLSQEDFGIAGMATTVLGAVCVLTNLGITGSAFAAHFEDDDEKRRYIDTIWTLELSRGFLIGTFMSLAAYPTSLFYHDHRLFPVVIVLSWVPFIGSLRNVGLGLMARDIQFARLTVVTLIETTFGVATAIFLAWYLRSYWALVWAQAGSATFGLVLSYLCHPYRSRLCFDKAAMRAGINFGKYIFVIGLSAFIVTTMDNIVLGKLLGASILGFYLIAFSASSLLTNVIGQVLGTVFLPTFARLKREQPDNLRPSITRAFTVGLLLLTVSTAPFIVLAPEIISVLYGSKWVGAAEPMRLLAIAGFFRGALGLLGPILMGMNRPDIESRTKVVEAAVFLATIYPLVKYFGMVGAACAGILTFVVSLLLQFWFVEKSFPTLLQDIPRLILISIFSIATGSVMGYTALSILGNHADMTRITVGLSASCIATFCSFYVLCPQSKTELLGVVGLLKEKFSSRQKFN